MSAHTSWAQTPDVIPTMVATLKLIFHIFMTCPFWIRAAIGLPAISLASNSAVKAGYLEEYESFADFNDSPVSIFAIRKLEHEIEMEKAALREQGPPLGQNG